MSITAASLLVHVGADTANAERGLAGIGSTLENLAKRATVAGATLTATVTAPLAAIANQALSSAMDYQSGLNVFRAVSGATAEQMAEVQQRAEALGADMQLPATSAADAAQAMIELSKAGLSVTDTLDAARGVLQMSAAGELSNADAAMITANALNSFGLEGSEAARIADLLAAAANASSSSVSGMADSLQMSSAVYAAAGVPIEDLVALISEMSNAGIQGSDAGTSLKQMLLSMQAPSDKAADLMLGLGLSVYDAAGNLKSMDTIIADFSATMADMTQQQRDQALATIFGSDAVRAANVIFGGGVDTFQEMRDTVTEEGAAAELAGAQMAGLKGALEGLKSQMETLLLQVMTPLLPMLEKIVRWVADKLVPWLQNLNPEVRNAGLAFAAVAAAAGPVITAFGAIVLAVGAIGVPILAVVAAVGVLAAAWAGDFGGIREATSQAFEAIKGAVSSFIETVGPIWATFSEAVGGVITHIAADLLPFFQQRLGEMSAFFQAKFGVIKTWIDENMPLIQATITTVMGAIKAVWDAVWPYLSGVVQTSWEVIQVIVGGALDALLGLIKTIMLAINGDWAGAWKELLSVLEGIWGTITDAFATFIGGIYSTITGKVGDFLQVGRDLMTGLYDGIKEKAQDIIDGVKGVVNDAIEGAKRLLGIHSPSAVFAEIGEMTMRGLAQGITSQETLPSRAVAQSISNMTRTSIVHVGGISVSSPNPERAGDSVLRKLRAMGAL